jgi:Flp pilus assembly protein TadD
MKDRIVVAILMFILCPLGGNLLAQENPKTAEAHYKQAEELLKKNQDAKAIVEATQAIKLKPNYWEAYSVRGMAYARTRAFDKAIADLSEAIRLNPTDPN